MSYDEGAARARRLDSGGGFEDLRSDTTPQFFHRGPRPTTLEQLAADVRQHPLKDEGDVRGIASIIARMATDAGWRPEAHEVYEAQRASRTWTYQRFMGMVAKRELLPYQLAALAETILTDLRN